MSAERHLLLVSYLFPPSDASGMRRVVGLRRALESRGVRTTVLTSAASGRQATDAQDGVVRAPDLRAHLNGRQRVLSGQATGPVKGNQRAPFGRLFVPDTTAATWAPTAVRELRRVVARDRPTAVLTSSPPESVHLVGLAAKAMGLPWLADMRDGWRYEPPTQRPWLSSLDGRLERLVVERADVVTAVTEPIANDLRRRYDLDGRVVHLTNGFDPQALRAATDERGALDSGRFSLVYTGSGAVDGKDLRGFLAALRTVLVTRPDWRRRLEVVLAGNFTDVERGVIAGPALDDVVRRLNGSPTRGPSGSSGRPTACSYSHRWA